MQKLIFFLKKFSFYFLVIFAGTYLQVYWAMGYLSDKLSSSCLDCSFALDTLFVSLFSAVFLSLFFMLISRIKNLYLKLILEFLLLSFWWFFIDYSDFVERESSWSTYLFEEEIHATLNQGFFPILIISVIVIFIFNYKFFINKNEAN
ncbi:MAG: hypothetical protein E2600_11810 [Chryseobacterium sp.]|nr:hypothetical protein [Chryseobacterium sp.]